MRTRLLGFTAALVAAFGGAYLVGDNVDPIVDDDAPLESHGDGDTEGTDDHGDSGGGGGFGRDHGDHTP